MMWRINILIAALLIPLWTKAAPAVGQITGININPNGWLAEVYIYQMATNGTFNYGFAGSSNNVYSSTNFALTLTSMGFDTACNPTTVVQVIPATKTIRFPYPDQTLTNRIMTNSDYIVISCALAEFVSSFDSNITANVATNWYVDGAGGNIATNGLAVTNSSLQPYPKVLAHEGWVPYQEITNDTFTLKAVAFHGSAVTNPAQVVKFWSISQVGATNEPVIVTSPSRTTNMLETPAGDKVTNVVIEFTATLYCTNFNSRQTFTNHFSAYPRIGTTNEVYDTSGLVNGNSWPPKTVSASAQYVVLPHIYLCNRSNDLGYTYAIVDPVNGTQAGVVVTNWSTPPTAPFQYFFQAASACALTNFFVHGRSNYDGARIYLTNGNIEFPGGTVTNRGPSSTWVICEPHPNAPTNNVQITNVGAGTIQGSLKILLRNMWLTMPYDNKSYLSNNPTAFWLDGIVKTTNTGAGALFANGQSNVWVTRSTFYYQANTIRRNNPGNRDQMFFRDNVFYQPTKIWHSPFFVGNLFLPVTATNFAFVNDGAGYYADPVIFAYNHIYRVNAVDPALKLNSTSNVMYGIAVVQNVIERSSKQVGAPGALISFGVRDPPAPPGVAMTNLICWNNTFVGQRWLERYNDASNFVNYSVLDSFHCNVNDEIGVKHDTFTGAPPPGAYEGRTNRWAVLYSVARRGECWGGIWGSGTFHPENTSMPNHGFNGLYTLGLPLLATNTIDAAFLFYRNGAYRTNVNDAAGFGDYRPMTNSVLIGLEPYPVLPWDLMGQVRYPGGAAGAFEVYQIPAAPSAPLGRRYRFRWGF